MSFDYASKASLALQLLTDFGQPVTLVHATGTTYDPATSKTTQTTETKTGKAAVFPYADGVTGKPGSLIQQGDLEVLLDAINIPAVAPGDKVTISGILYDVVNVKAIAPAGVNVLFTLQVRR